MKRLTPQQHKEVAMLCEEGMTTIKAKSALLVPYKQHHQKQRVIHGKLTSIAQIME
jgi:hypothetical protein